MRIGFFELEGWENKNILRELHAHEVYLTRETLTANTLPTERNLEIISVFVDSRITDKVIDHFPKLKLVTTRSTGYDHIDLQACKARNVQVARVSGYGDNTVAEFAFGSLLNITRKIYESIDRTKESSSFSITGLRGTDLLGKTLGIIGTGRVGKEMVRIASGFGMRVVACDIAPDAEFARQTGTEYCSLEDLLKKSDVISIHCPLKNETKHLLNKNNVGLMKRGVYLINTARGGIISSEALIYGLREGIIAGAALDVLEEEGETKDELQLLTSGHPRADELAEMLRNHILMKMPNVHITPHIAFNSAEAMQRILHTTILNINSFIEGQPTNLVTQ